MPDFATNLQRLMARAGLTVGEVAARSGLDERTIKGVLNGTIARPHARTLHKLAAGLESSTDELFQNTSLLAPRSFDRLTNPMVDEVAAAAPELFDGWNEADFDEIYSRFGTGGELTHEGVQAAAEKMNRNRETHTKLALLLECEEGELLSQVIDAFYRRVIVGECDCLAGRDGS